MLYYGVNPINNNGKSISFNQQFQFLLSHHFQFQHKRRFFIKLIL